MHRILGCDASLPLPLPWGLLLVPIPDRNARAETVDVSDRETAQK